MSERVNWGLSVIVVLLLVGLVASVSMLYINSAQQRSQIDQLEQENAQLSEENDDLREQVKSVRKDKQTLKEELEQQNETISNQSYRISTLSDRPDITLGELDATSTVSAGVDACWQNKCALVVQSEADVVDFTLYRNGSEYAVQHTDIAGSYLLDGKQNKSTIGGFRPNDTLVVTVDESYWGTEEYAYKIRENPDEWRKSGGIGLNYVRIENDRASVIVDTGTAPIQLVRISADKAGDNR